MRPVKPLPCLSVLALAVASLMLPTSSAQSTAPPAQSPATQPSTRPAALPAEQLLSQMLRPGERAARPLTPQSTAEVRDATSGRGATAPNAPQMSLLREGSFVIDRTGRLTRSADGMSGSAGAGAGFEFSFDADGRTLRDPPMLILPNLKLQTMEDAVKGANRDLRFRITGIITEYRGRNAVLIEKVVVVTDSTPQN